MLSRQLLDSIESELQQIESSIFDHFQIGLPLLEEVSSHILKAGGKRLRPVLLVLAARLFGKQGDAVIHAAKAIEYLHTATLLHDDVVDGAETRRSQKAASRIWGNHASVASGDYLLSKSFQMLADLRQLKILETLSHTTTLMAKGEILQLARVHQAPNQDQYLEIILNKTASLFGSAMKIGALLGEASEEQQQALYDYGIALGLAFQIVDDTLDYSNDPEKTGKPVGIDLKERKVTLPLSLLLQQAKPEEVSAIEAILEEGTITDAHVQQVIAWMRSYNCLEQSLDAARRYIQEAQACLDIIPESNNKQYLREITEFVVQRNS